MEASWPVCSAEGTRSGPGWRWRSARVTAALLDNIRAQGFNSVRIPVTWGQHMGGAPNYTVDAAWLARVKEVVDWALADGFYVMINVHHDSWQWLNTMPGDRANVQNKYNALWTQLAAAFRGSSPKLVFESV
ncbi:cellulase family glycosylhydrolase, partial [Dactylosporangium sp. NPDC005555]|uniref:glycoside hydrolase family 5 protein n=1 Tax=Dactylosporangium sp. NPDC005555 TaxID=3154889 RepID=UPI0033BA37A4